MRRTLRIIESVLLTACLLAVGCLMLPGCSFLGALGPGNYQWRAIKHAQEKAEKDKARREHVVEPGSE